MARHDTEVNYITNCDVNIPSRHFSIAKVKFVVGAGCSFDINGFAIYETDEYSSDNPPIAAFPQTIAEETVTLGIPMYKGGAYIAFFASGTVTVSGDLYHDSNTIYITGDGTVTVA